MQPTLLGHSTITTYLIMSRAYGPMQHETLRGAPFTRNALSASVLSRSMQACTCKAGGTWAGGTPEANLDVTLCALGQAPALSLLGVGADRPKWCPAESKMFRHADKALAGSFHRIRVVPARIVSPGAVQVGASSLRSLRRISSHSMRRSLQNGSYGSYYLLGPLLVTTGRFGKVPEPHVSREYPTHHRTLAHRQRYS